MRKNCKSFEQWVDSQCAEFGAVVDGNSWHTNHLSISVYSTFSSVVGSITNERTGKIGHATVKVENHDDPTRVVTALAWADYKGEEIPNFDK